MLSFFLKKKHSPDTPTEEAIQGPVDPAQANNGADDFIFVERKPTDDPASNNPPQQQNLIRVYPPMPSVPYGPTTGIGQYNPMITKLGNVPASYLQDVPFELSPQLSTKGSFDLTQMQVDRILAEMTRQMSVDEIADEYNFALERSIQNES